MAPSRQVGPAAAMNPANKAVPVPRPPKPAAKQPVQASKTSSTMALEAAPLPTPERRTPPRPSQTSAAPSSEQTPVEAKPALKVAAPAVDVKPSTGTEAEGKRSAAMEEMSKRAAQVRGVQATNATTDGVAPVVVPRKNPSPDSPAVKALQAKKDEIAKKIASGSVAAPSKSMAVGVPTRVAPTPSEAAAAPSPVQAPSIKERYATEGSSPLSAKSASNVPSKATSAAPSKLPSEVKQAQVAVSDAIKDVSSALGRAVHIHVHAPVHIHIGGGETKSKL